MRILTIVGARPQFIKAAAVSRSLRKRKEVTEKLVHTGQHYDANMSEVFFRELEIPRPEFNLGVGSAGHGAQTGQMLLAIEQLILDERPDVLLVYGDTNSTLAGALAAAKLHVPVAHVEAGLRSFNKRMPEEINRILTDHVSKWLLAPTITAMANLQREGFIGGVHLVGDVMFDVSRYYAERAEAQSPILNAHGLRHSGYVLATIHRAENTDSPARLRAIIDGFKVVSEKVPVVLPLHPRTRKKCIDQSLKIEASNLKVIDPVGYLDMIMLEKHAALIATDSGGVQKEAFFYRVPCVTLRDETEWVELVNSGWNRVVSPDSTISVARAVLDGLGSTGMETELYGDGASGDKIAEIICADT